MFNIGGGELIVIMLLALIVLGPTRLPDAARQVGKAMSDLRRLSTGFQNEVRSAIDLSDDPDQVAARRNLLAKETRVSTTARAAATPAPTASDPATPGKKQTKKAPPAKKASPAKTAGPTKKAPAKKKAPPKGKAAAKGTSATSKAVAKARPRPPKR